MNLFVTTGKMLYLRKRCHITLLTPHNGNVAQTATLVCVQGGRCGEVRLKYTHCIHHMTQTLANMLMVC